MVIPLLAYRRSLKTTCKVRNLAWALCLACALLVGRRAAAREAESLEGHGHREIDCVTILFQDTTRRPPKQQPTSRPEIDRALPRRITKPWYRSSPGSFNLLDFREHQFPGITFEVVDSLARLHPELKNYLLQQGIIQGALQEDLVQAERSKLLQRAFADLGLPTELEAQLRRNQALFGVTHNPMRPPPMPNQVDLLSLASAIANLLRLLGVK